MVSFSERCHHPLSHMTHLELSLALPFSSSRTKSCWFCFFNSSWIHPLPTTSNFNSDLHFLPDSSNSFLSSLPISSQVYLNCFLHIQASVMSWECCPCFHTPKMLCLKSYLPVSIELFLTPAMLPLFCSPHFHFFTLWQLLKTKGWREVWREEIKSTKELEPNFLMLFPFQS